MRTKKNGVISHPENVRLIEGFTGVYIPFLLQCR